MKYFKQQGKQSEGEPLFAHCLLRSSHQRRHHGNGCSHPLQSQFPLQQAILTVTDAPIGAPFPKQLC